MENVFCRFGEHIFRIQSESEYLLEHFNDPFLMRKTVHTTDISILLVDGFGVPFVNFDVEIAKNDNGLTYSRADYLIEIDHDFKQAKVSVHDDFALKHALMNLYSSFIVYHNWGLLIHSSCAIENEQAHIFTGQSGAGKSTAAKLSAPRELLSDEASIIKISSNEITVYNSPFRSEIAPKGLGEPRPLASIQLLNQSLKNNSVRLKKSDALINLLDKVFYWIHSPEETAKIFGMLNDLVEKVPVYELYFQKNNRFWELIS